MTKNQKEQMTLSNAPEILNLAELCRVFRVCKQTAYKLLKSGYLPAVKVGRNYKISKSAVESFLTLPQGENK